MVRLRPTKNVSPTVAMITDPTAVPTTRAIGRPANSNNGSGIFSNVTFVQRLETEGGVAPTGRCGTEGAELAVPYEADYYFYTGGI
jgi:hypothetical protein